MNRKALGLVLLASAASFVVASAAMVPSTQVAVAQAAVAKGDAAFAKRDIEPPAGTLTIVRPLENEITTLEIIKADAPGAEGKTVYFGRTEWYPQGSEKASCFRTLITLGGAGVKPTAAFTRIDRNTMLVGSDNNALKITFTGKENKMLTATVENVQQGKLVMVVTAKGNWEIADASRFSRSLPALISALSAEVGTQCTPSYNDAFNTTKEGCKPNAVKTFDYTCDTTTGSLIIKSACDTPRH